ncbi:MAG: serine hydrolase domain-containing protein [Bacillota bacterium]|nr:serine hydrolase domain-containing protein [Bacillota bacterium]
MKKIKYAIVISIILMAILTTASPVFSSELDFSIIDNYIEQEMRFSRIPGLSLGIVKNGEIVYLQGYGRTGDKQQVTPQTPFVIGSNSKSFTALAAMQLVEEGRLELDKPVRSYLPWFSMSGEFDSSEITIRHLLVQTSGISNAAGNTRILEDDSNTLEEEIRELENVSLVHRPGKAYIYSNVNYDILGLIIDTISNQGYVDHVRTRILSPLDMQNSFLTREDGEKAGLTPGHIKVFGFPVSPELQYLKNSLSSGFIISCAEDMSRYLVMHLGNGLYEGNTIISEEGLETIYQPGATESGDSEYAMGLIVRSDDNSRLIMHDGGTQGFNSGMVFSPEEQWGVVVLTNMTSMFEMPAMSIALGVTEIVRGNETPALNRIQGISYLVVLVIILVLLTLIIRSMIRLPKRWRKIISENRPAGFKQILRKVILPVILELIIPFIIFIFIPVNAGFPVWRLLALMNPDIVYGLLILSSLLMIKALWRIYLAIRISG